MKETTKPRDKTQAEDKTKISSNNVRTLFLAINLSLIFSLGAFFLMMMVTRELDIFLKNYIPDPWNASSYDEIQQLTTQYDSVVTFLRPIVYISFWLMITTIILGVIIERYKLSFLGSLTLYLPIFGHFAGIMILIFVGIGVLRTLWIPVLDLDPELLNLGAIFYFPLLIFFLIAYIMTSLFFELEESLLIPLLGEEMARLIEYELYYMIFLYISVMGFFIFIFGVVTWLYGRFQSRKVIDFWIYRYSRHPQYLGLIIWNYGLLMLSIVSPIGLSPPTFPFLVLTLVIIGMAMNEENTMIQHHIEEYIIWRERTAFLFPLPGRIKSLINYPMRKLMKKEWPKNNKDIIRVLLIYGAIMVILSVPLLNYYIILH
ncbi:MAG: methyltransferase family protein [Candidatus Hodarchaeales archaeon]|jgi:protein-S-isoprenylcysteine O-methyltransferase Ste14